MNFFTSIDGSVLLKSRGVYKEAPLLRNDKGELFVKYGQGAVRLLPHNATSIPKLYWNEIQSAEPFAVCGPYMVLAAYAFSPSKKKAA